MAGLVWAEQIIPSGIASLFIGATPLWMALLDTLRPGGIRLSWLTWAGVLTGFAGIALLANPWRNGLDGLHLDPWGVIVLLLAALSWSIGSLYSRKAPSARFPLDGHRHGNAGWQPGSVPFRQPGRRMGSAGAELPSLPARCSGCST